MSSAHLEYQEHPANAKADEGAENEVDHPHQAELQGYHHKGWWVSEGLEV